ncbi:hypothetical protein [Actinomadura sp. 3N508]|uniref:hypothetical protein n=1 Tax=Actinomadura sp. 3N508 TaxID=3375153 RepID=UPI00379280DD
MLGFDEQGREVLTFLHGDTIGERHPWPAWPHSDEALRQVAAWMRRLHDVTATFVPPDGATWLAGAVIGRARRQAAIIRQIAQGGQASLLPFAADLEQAATEVEALPPSFWRA